jgi:general secretion pathway protein H
LLEIVVVLFVLGLILLLVYPKVETLTENGLRKASRNLVGVIQHLYYQSMATRQIHRLSYDIEESGYRVDVVGPRGELSPPASPVDHRVPLPRDVRFQDVVTLRQGKVTEGEAMTQFYPAGLVEKTVIHLTDQDQHVLTLDINPLTGRVKVYDGYVKEE